MDPILRYYSLPALLAMCETLLTDPNLNWESLAEVRRIRHEVEFRAEHNLWVR